MSDMYRVLPFHSQTEAVPTELDLHYSDTGVCRGSIRTPSPAKQSYAGLDRISPSQNRYCATLAHTQQVPRTPLFAHNPKLPPRN